MLQGPQNILITASDPGPGVYEAIFQIDGKTVSSSVLSSNGGRCENVGETSNGIPAFLYLQPCPAQVNSVDVPFEPGVVPEGPHDLRVLVSDAAGNTTTILDHQVVIDTTGAYTTLLARGQCNGDACDDHAQLVPSIPLHATFLRRFGRSAITLTGRLLDHTGAAISDAQVLLLQTPEAAGESPVQVASTTTDASGDWSFAAPKGPARLLQVTYFSHLKDSTPAAVLDYDERVKAAVLLHAPHRVRLGRAVVFEGRLLGGDIPSGGEPVQMEIYYRRRWRTIEVIHTNRHGRFAYRYIFTLGPGVSYASGRSRSQTRRTRSSAAASRPIRVRGPRGIPRRRPLARAGLVGTWRSPPRSRSRRHGPSVRALGRGGRRRRTSVSASQASFRLTTARSYRSPARPAQPAGVCIIDSGVDLNPDTRRSSSIAKRSTAGAPTTSAPICMALAWRWKPLRCRGTIGGWSVLRRARCGSSRSERPTTEDASELRRVQAGGARVRAARRESYNIKVISLSIGFQGTPTPRTAGRTRRTRSAGRSRSTYGLDVVAAAGDEGAAQVSYPAAAPGVVAVGAAGCAARTRARSPTRDRSLRCSPQAATSRRPTR